MESGVDTLKSLCSPAARWGGAPNAAQQSRATADFRPRLCCYGPTATEQPSCGTEVRGREEWGRFSILLAALLFVAAQHVAAASAVAVAADC